MRWRLVAAAREHRFERDIIGQFFGDREYFQIVEVRVGLEGYRSCIVRSHRLQFRVGKCAACIEYIDAGRCSHALDGKNKQQERDNQALHTLGLHQCDASN